MYKLSVNKIQLLLLVMMSVSLHGMLSVENNNAVVWDVFIAHSLSCNDYDTYRNIAILNKECNEIVEDTYRLDKKRIEKYIATDLPQAQITGYISWNKNFSACAWMNYDGNVADPKDFKLTLVGVLHNQVITQSASWKDFYFPIFEEDIRPFFDKDGQAYFYGYGKTQACNDYHPSFAQYCLDLNGNALRDRYRFLYYINPEDMNSLSRQGLHTLLQYPVLAKVFLQSKQVRVTRCCHQYDREKICDIRGVTLPDDYKTFKKSIGLELIENKSQFLVYSRYTSYDSLDNDVKKAIDAHYKKQQHGENNTISREK